MSRDPSPRLALATGSFDSSSSNMSTSRNTLNNNNKQTTKTKLAVTMSRWGWVKGGLLVVLLNGLVLLLNDVRVTRFNGGGNDTSIRRRANVPHQLMSLSTPSLSDSQSPSIPKEKTTLTDNTTKLMESIVDSSKSLSLLSFPKRIPGIQTDFVQKDDYIYMGGPREDAWDEAPVIIESHKLVFFTVPKVGCTVWKQLFRRMMGYQDYQNQNPRNVMPHNPRVNGLKYLTDYSLHNASIIMTSPEWTRAIMVREPKQRFLSAFLDKVVNHPVFIKLKCCPDGSCVEKASRGLSDFLDLAKKCENAHWRSQHERVDAKYWPYMDHVLHLETAETDAKALLTKIGAWEDYGASGWGSNGTSTIFQAKGKSGAGNHATFSNSHVWEWYTPSVERHVEEYYQTDYANPFLQFEKDVCLTCPTTEEEATS